MLSLEEGYAVQSVLKLFDMPGVHLHHRQAAVVHSEDLPALAPRSRLKGHSFPSYKVASENRMAEKIQSDGLNGFSLFWGGLVRVDILKVLPETCLTFYGPKAEGSADSCSGH